jgi:hypothetical protein
MSEFLIEVDKFYQTYELNSEFELGLHIQMQYETIPRFKPKSKGFEPNSVYIAMDLK